jgi:hypothetical protein
MESAYYDKNWAFRGVMIIPAGSRVEIHAARHDYLDDLYEAGEIQDIDRKITYRAADNCYPYELGWGDTVTLGQVENIIVEPARTLFTLVPPTEGSEE